MNVFQFVMEVASYLQEKTGLDFRKSVEGQKERLERRGFELRPINHALSEAIRAIAPDRAEAIIDNKTVRASRLVARLLRRAARASHPTEEKNWQESPAYQTSLGLAFGLFLGLLSRRPPADENGLTLEERIATLVQEQASMTIQRWGFLMMDPGNLLAAAEVVAKSAPEERLNRLEEMVRTFSNLRSRVTPEEFRAVVTAILLQPAKA